MEKIRSGTSRKKRRKNQMCALLSMSLGSLVLTYGQANAADDPRRDQEEIVVTATRRSEELSKVPLSISAYTQQTMDDLSVRSVADIARLTPGLYVTPSAGANVGYRSNISIRGISSGVGSATTGVYINDTPVQVRPVGNVSTNAYPIIFDLDRVEVLRGPQGTLFGAGAEGGAVRFLTPKPSLESVSMYARADLGFTVYGDPSYEAGAAIGAPIVDGKLGYRVSASYRHAGGWIDRRDSTSGQVAQPNANSEDDYTARIAFEWRPTDSISIRPGVFFQKQSINDRGAFFENLSNPDDGRFVSGTALRQPYDDRFALSTLDMEWNTKVPLLGDITVISNTSYFDRKTTQTGDFTASIGALLFGSPTPFIPGYYERADYTDSQRAWTQEIRIQSADPNARLHWVLGGYYGTNDQYSLQANLSPFLAQAVAQKFGGATIAQVLGVPLYQDTYSFYAPRTGAEGQKAVYGQVDLKLLDNVTLVAGARWARTSFSFARFGNGPIAGGSTYVTGEQGESPFTPKVGLSWQADQNNLLYASVSKGYRIGGVNAPPSAFCASSLASLGITTTPTVYKSDNTLSYEIGAKNKIGDGLSVDASAFYVKWNDIQRGIPLSGCGSEFVANLGTATSKGFNLALQYRVTPALTLSGSVGYTKATLDDTLRGTGTIILGAKGQTVTDAPLWTATIAGDYRFNFIGQNAFVHADFQYLSPGQRGDPTTFGYDPQILPAEAIHQLSLRAGVERDGYEIAAYINNALNESARLSRTHDTATSPLYYLTTMRPLTVGLTATLRY